MVHWGSSVSEAFGPSNGVRQDMVLSLHLFNVYSLSEILNRVNIGCMISNVRFNHLMYADDTVLISLSAIGHILCNVHHSDAVIHNSI